MFLNYNYKLNLAKNVLQHLCRNTTFRLLNALEILYPSYEIIP